MLDARIKELVNFVDGFYQKLGIRVVLSHVEVWNRTNRAEVSDNPTQVRNFKVFIARYFYTENCLYKFLCQEVA